MKLDLSKLSNLNQRIIAGLSGAIFMVTCICFGEWTYFGLFFGISYLALIEFYKLLKSNDVRPNKTFGVFSGMVVFVLFFLIEKNFIESKFYFLLLPLLFSLFLFELFRNADKPIINIAFTFLGTIYVALPFALLHVAAYAKGDYNYKFILGIILLLWANDVGGYIFGVSMGKTKLFPRISPKKTWEGTLGGGFFALLTSVGLSYFIADLYLYQWVILAFLIAIFGSYGDLVESLFKRNLAIKDSATTIPGHGGFLDRFDGLLLAAPFIAAFMKLFI